MNETQQTQRPGSGATAPGAAQRPSADEIVAWVLGFLAEILDVPPQDIDPATPLDELGVDSATTLVLCAGLGEEFALHVRPRDVFDHFTADALARHLTAPLPAGV